MIAVFKLNLKRPAYIIITTLNYETDYNSEYIERYDSDNTQFIVNYDI